MNEFEEIIKNDASLSKLLSDKQITVFSNFSKTDYSDELKNYIQERYYDVFKELYWQGIEENNEGQASALIRSSEFLATEKTKCLLVEEFNVTLKRTYDNLLAFKALLADNSEEIHFTVSLDEPIDGLSVNIFNRFGYSETINDYKTKIIGAALDICDVVSKISPKRSPFKYAVYNAVMNNLLKIDDFGSLHERYETHRRKISNKRTGIEVKYVILTIVVVILILLRVISRLD